MHSILKPVRKSLLRCPRHRYLWSGVTQFLGPKLIVDDVELFNTTNKNLPISSITTHNDTDYGGGSSTSHSFLDENGKSFLRFEGQLNFNSDHKTTTKARGGFCALKVNYAESFDLRDYNGLVFELRSTKDQKFLVNLSFESFVKGDMFQLRLELTADSEWKQIFLPFHLFQLTSQGNLKAVPMVNDNLQFKSFGLLLTSELASKLSQARELETENSSDEGCETSEEPESFSIDIAKVYAVEEEPNWSRK